MRLISCHIDNFGKLSDLDMRFDEGLNAVLRENGWGKTTLTVFIKAMLYGLPRSTKRKLDENERKKYTPWKGGAYGGELELAVGEKEYRIERYFSDAESGDTFALYDRKTNLPSADYGADIGEKLFGLNAAAYERSVYFSQRGAVEEGSENSISAKLNGLLEDDEDIGALDQALEGLDKARKEYKLDRGTGGRIDELEASRADILARRDRALRADARLKEAEGELSRARAAAKEAEAACERAEEAFRAAGQERNRLQMQNTYRELVKKLRDSQGKEEECLRFFGGSAPSEEALAAAERAEAEAKLKEGELSVLASADDEDLRTLFARGVPDEEELAAYEAAAKEEGELRGALRTVYPVDDATYVRYVRDRETAQEELKGYARLNGEGAEDRLAQAKEEAARAKAAADEAAARPKPKDRRLPAFLGTAIGTCAAAIACALSLPRPAAYFAAIACGVLALLFAALTAMSARSLSKRRKAAKREAAELAEAYELARTRETEAQQTLFAVQQRAMLEERLGRIGREIATYELYSAKKAEADALTQRLTAGHKRYPLRADTWSAWAHGLRAKAETYAKVCLAAQRAETLRAEAEKLHADAQAFSAKYGGSLKEIRSRLLAYGVYAENAARDRVRLSAFEAENGLTQAFLTEALSDRTEQTGQLCRRTRQEMSQAQARANEAEAAAERERETAETLPDVEAELSLAENELAAAKERHFVLSETAKYLRKAREELSARYLGAMKESFLRHLGSFGGEKLGRFEMDARMDVVFKAEGKRQDIAALSQGYQCVVSLCARFALVDALFANEKPFLILDDPFAELDGENLSIARGMLAQAAKSYQILYLVCHESRS